MDQGFPRFTVSDKAERSVRLGHPWVYDTEILSGEGEDGSLATVLNRKGRWLGTALFNSRSKIRLRLISRNTNDDFSESFFERRLRHAVDYRRTVMGPDFSCCRLIFGEADFFPGLTVDRFGSILVAQTLSLGMEQRKEMIFRLLIKILREEGETIDALYERNDVRIRELEGMEQGKGFFEMEGLSKDLSGVTEICENGIRYEVDYVNGQKTGFFLDQKYNRQAAARLAPGRRVLDCFTHTGAFALNAAKAGAEHVCAVDVSADALAMARKNAERNDLTGNMSFREANVFELLTAMGDAKNREYDYIILDPPAFTKSHGTVHSAERGYHEINRRAMQILPRGGYLATCSCSHFMTEELFCKMLRHAASDAGRSLRQIEARQQSPDHPILWNVPETNYLKFYLFQVV
ncbi:MAG TPA: class I SAM-dependent rRNA methyltransferase [Candidatus Caccousia stercoris]|uniref:Class I SAM-dependent rRNA methyltransferase n=1 Tax=Candidatus Caccousia stercoris TaxID=2840723 RepID=A0A9D1FRN1_9FIRM|nr:class I SAM-dependent rRNA methyltransferase [Candidatus Caccousia stercoris]